MTTPSVRSDHIAPAPEFRLAVTPDHPRPGDRITVQVDWDHVARSTAIDVRLCWLLATPAQQRVIVNARESEPYPFTRGSRAFTFTLPQTPCTIHGRLMRILWLVEVVLLPTRHCVRLGFVVSPDGEAVVLQGGDAECHEFAFDRVAKDVPEDW